MKRICLSLVAFSLLFILTFTSTNATYASPTQHAQTTKATNCTYHQGTAGAINDVGTQQQIGLAILYVDGCGNAEMECIALIGVINHCYYRGYTLNNQFVTGPDYGAGGVSSDVGTGPISGFASLSTCGVVQYAPKSYWGSNCTDGINV